jgi:hypothetical protein
MMPAPFSLRSAAAAVLLLLVAGCGGDPDQLMPVHGKVFYQSVPLGGGTIVFTPDSTKGGTGQQAHAEIQSDGSFVLKTGDRPGAVPGWHRITIVALDAISAPAGPGYAAPRSLLPVKYRDPDLSGLSCEVKEGQANTVELNLE